MSVAIALPEASRGSYREMWLITLGHSLTHWYPATFYLILPIIGRELGLSYSQIGLIMTCQYIAGAVANIPGGVLVDTVGRKGVLMATSLFWVGFPYLLMGFARLGHAVLARLFPRPARAVPQPGAHSALDQLRVPLDDAERAAHFPARVSRVRNGLFALLGGRLHVRAAGRGLRRRARRRAPVGPDGPQERDDDEH